MLNRIRNALMRSVVFPLRWGWRFEEWFAIPEAWDKDRVITRYVVCYRPKGRRKAYLAATTLHGKLHFFPLTDIRLDHKYRQVELEAYRGKGNSCDIRYTDDSMTSEAERYIFWRWLLTGDPELAHTLHFEGVRQHLVYKQWMLSDDIWTTLEKALWRVRGTNETYDDLHEFVEEAKWAVRFAWPLMYNHAVLTDMERVEKMKLDLGGQALPV